MYIYIYIYIYINIYIYVYVLNRIFQISCDVSYFIFYLVTLTYCKFPQVNSLKHKTHKSSRTTILFTQKELRVYQVEV